MAPRTRAAEARAAAAAAATCLLLDLSHDEVSIVTHELCDPLEPLLAVHLSSTAKGLRAGSTLAAFLWSSLITEPLRS